VPPWIQAMSLWGARPGVAGREAGGPLATIGAASPIIRLPLVTLGGGQEEVITPLG
jgi:hypothetical protein